VFLNHHLLALTAHTNRIASLYVRPLSLPVLACYKVFFRIRFLCAGLIIYWYATYHLPRHIREYGLSSSY